MPKNSRRMTTAQFAKLHEVNKRTLHYYDSIGLFSPRAKGENAYRYYDAAQSMDFEYIRMLKELNMSIEEIQAYAERPNTEDFVRIADQKLSEIETQIRKLKHTERILRTKRSSFWRAGRTRISGQHRRACRAGVSDASGGRGRGRHGGFFPVCEGMLGDRAVPDGHRKLYFP